LADRVDEVIAVEREAVADLSHRLRTPLTALRLDVDAIDDPETSALLSEHVDVLERTLTQIIFTARRPQREGRAPHSDATEVVSERAAFWSALAEDQDRAVTVSLPAEPLVVRAATEDLAAAVDALIENVIAHTPEGSGLEIDVHAVDSSHVSVSISDEGPGIPPSLWTRGRSDRGSSGIGLDIVRRCAEASGGSMTITDRAPSGSTVEMLLRRA
ncbi:MAG TPA: HAMP domain-containing sensor histidine kinase, partial [Nocardioidaceae bacterium]|nr:HAMP domain-containing sensor histidine kinase [Nocardioidaceae bacterium]